MNTRSYPSITLALLPAILVLAGCDAPGKLSASSTSEPELVAYSDYETCVAADSAASVVLYQTKRRIPVDDMAPVRAMIASCKPVLAMFDWSPDPSERKLGDDCVIGYGLKIDIYELFLTGMSVEAGRNTLTNADRLLDRCDKSMVQRLLVRQG